MINYFLTAFGNMQVSDVVIFIAAIVFIAKIGQTCYKRIIKDYEIKQEKEETLQQILVDIRQIQQNQKEVGESIKVLADKQKEIVEKQVEFENKSREHNLNKLRDRLLQSYRFYTNADLNPRLAWSRMEKEVFDNLFKDYEGMNGNGLLHETVQPAMEKLVVIPMDDLEGIADLMASRKG